MQNLIKIFNVLAKYHTHEGVYFTGPSPEEIDADDLQVMFDCGVEWLADQKMWKKNVTLPDVVVSHIEEQSEFLRSSFTDLKSKL